LKLAEAVPFLRRVVFLFWQKLSEPCPSCDKLCVLWPAGEEQFFA
jgi:hypothetical protein